MCDGDYVMLKGLSHSTDQSNKMCTKLYVWDTRNDKMRERNEKLFNRRLSDLIKFIDDIFH